MTQTVSTKDVAKYLRGALRSAFPGVVFAVRCGRGTVSNRIYVNWTDGPPESEVQQLADIWNGADFDAITDSQVSRGATLLVSTGDELPQQVVLCVEGIRCERTLSFDRLAAAQRFIDARRPELQLADPVTGEVVSTDFVDDGFIAGEFVSGKPESVLGKISDAFEQARP